MSESSRRGVRSIFDPESFRKKREDDTISIRKQKREEQNLKRRMLMASSGAAGDATTPAQMASQPLAAPVVTPGATPGAAATTQPVLAKMPVPGSDRFTNPAELLQALQSPDVTLHLQAATHIRRILSIGLLFTKTQHFCCCSQLSISHTLGCFCCCFFKQRNRLRLTR